MPSDGSSASEMGENKGCPSHYPILSRRKQAVISVVVVFVDPAVVSQIWVWNEGGRGCFPKTQNRENTRRATGLTEEKRSVGSNRQVGELARARTRMPQRPRVGRYIGCSVHTVYGVYLCMP